MFPGIYQSFKCMYLVLFSHIFSSWSLYGTDSEILVCMKIIYKLVKMQIPRLSPKCMI